MFFTCRNNVTMYRTLPEIELRKDLSTFKNE